MADQPHSDELNSNRPRCAAAVLAWTLACFIDLWSLSAATAQEDTARIKTQPVSATRPMDKQPAGGRSTDTMPADVAPVPEDVVEAAKDQKPVTPVPPQITLSEYDPRPQLHVDRTEVAAAAFPAVDAHTHMFFRTRQDPDFLDAFVQRMDENNVAVAVSLDGTLGGRLHSHIDYLWEEYRDRFVIFANIDFQGEADDEDWTSWACNQPGFVRHTCEQLREAADLGVSGLKFFKGFGLQYRNPDGGLIRIDDPRFDPIWELCGELGLPVIMHTADPSAFFEPIGPHNERAEELLRHPDWSFAGRDVPPRGELHAARNRVVERHPKTTFIAAHMGNDAEDLSETARWLDRYPNLYVEMASRINELGRQPYTARRFFLKYQDRILFGTDGPWAAERWNAYWRFLQTQDEYFAYSEKSPPPQGLWNIYGIYLPDDVLRKVYSGNAAKIIPGVAERLAKYKGRHADLP